MHDLGGKKKKKDGQGDFERPTKGGKISCEKHENYGYRGKKGKNDKTESEGDQD